MSFAHLHVHSEYSLLDGTAKVDALAERAAFFEQPALALTDHGVMSGAVELATACRRHGITPIQGCEVYLVDDRRARPTGRLERHHLTLLAATPIGFHNLVKISSAGFLEGYQRGRPSVDLDLLASRAEGVIVLSGCLQSRLCQRIVDGRAQDARAHADDLVHVFGPENVYFEVQRNGLAEQDQANDGVARIARELRRPLVATADVHYLRREDYLAHAAWLCVQTKSTLAQPKIRFETNEFYLRSSEEMAELFSDWPEAVSGTIEIAERCTVELDLGGHLIPRYPAPDGLTEDAYLRQLVDQGLRQRYGEPVPANAQARAHHELRVLARRGFSSYFLIVWDYVRHAKDHGIAVGPGRGAVGGSIVAYCLGITEVDPLAHTLLFERFINLVTAVPDIDLDFSVRGREEVIRYVTAKYGAESVAQIITFGRLFPRHATRDAARVLGHDYAIADRLAMLIPDPVMGRPPSFEDCLGPGEPLRTEIDRDPTAREIINIARGLDGILRNSSIHASAVAIADGALTDIVPLQVLDWGMDEHGQRSLRTVTQFTMKAVEQIGVLKMDFLGLWTLDGIERTLDAIERATGVRVDVARLPLDDQVVYEMLARGDTDGVFSFRSEGMRDALKRVEPDTLDDLAALIALYRPRVFQLISAYAARKATSAGSIRYADKRVHPILASTYGMVVYQEQIMQIAHELAGFTLARADQLRKVLGKHRDAMAQLKVDFLAGCQASGTVSDVATHLWDDCVEASDYAFNRAHAVSYALLAYWTAWLKAHYPERFEQGMLADP